MLARTVDEQTRLPFRYIMVRNGGVVAARQLCGCFRIFSFPPVTCSLSLKDFRVSFARWY